MRNTKVVGILLSLLLLAGVAAGQYIQTPPQYWYVVGAGALAARPATCTANWHVWICNGAGCIVNGEYHYCTALNTWTVASGGAMGPAGGALAGTYPNPTLAGVATVNVLPKISAVPGVLTESMISCTGSPLTCMVYDPTATTGSTTLKLLPGAGQSTTRLLDVWLNAAGTTPGLHVQANGNVGIGTTSPSSKLDIWGTGGALLQMTGTNTAVPVYGFVSSNGTNGLYFGQEGSGANSFFSGTLANASALGTTNATALQFGTSNTIRVTVDATNGNVGIGTTTLSGKLSVAGTPGNVPYWTKYSVVKIANGVGGCTNAKGCWSVNGGTAVNAATATTQVITWLAAPANAVLQRARWKTATACAGLTAITLTDMGTTASASEFFTGGTYNLKTAVGDTNLLWPALLTPGLTAAATNWNVTISGVAENIDDITDGCAFAIQAEWAVLP